MRSFAVALLLAAIAGAAVWSQTEELVEKHGRSLELDSVAIAVLPATERALERLAPKSADQTAAKPEFEVRFAGSGAYRLQCVLLQPDGNTSFVMWTNPPAIEVPERNEQQPVQVALDPNELRAVLKRLRH